MIEPDPKLGRITFQLKRLFSRLLKRGDRKEDFIEQIHEAEEHSVLNADAVSMMEGVLQISDLAVRDVMVPRARMDFINLEENVNNILDFVTKIAARIVPDITPDITKIPYDFIILKSTALCLLWVKTETNEVGIIIANEVPTAKCITYVLSIPKASNIKNKNGTVINPPPIPNKPAKNPTGIAVNIISKIK